MSVTLQTAHSPHAPAESPKVLFAEDQRRVREEMMAQFGELELTPLLTGSGIEALRIASDERPDIIFLDGLLPEMHGFEIARLIRSLDPDYRPHIAIVTGIYKQARYRNEASLRYGIDSYLVKPVSTEQIADVVARWYRGRPLAAMAAVGLVDSSSSTRQGPVREFGYQAEVA